MTTDEKNDIKDRMISIFYHVLSARLPLLREVECKDGEDRMQDPEYRKAVKERLELIRSLRDTVREVADETL